MRKGQLYLLLLIVTSMVGGCRRDNRSGAGGEEKPDARSEGINK